VRLRRYISSHQTFSDGEEPVVPVASDGAITHFCLRFQFARLNTHRLIRQSFSKTSPVISGLPL
jgi:hypothetical protein